MATTRVAGLRFDPLGRHCCSAIDSISKSFHGEAPRPRSSEASPPVAYMMRTR